MLFQLLQTAMDPLQEALLAEEWKHPYSREQAAYPVPGLRLNKFWPTVARVDNVFGDRKVVPRWEEDVEPAKLQMTG
jgi:hypothetical protein